MIKPKPTYLLSRFFAAAVLGVSAMFASSSGYCDGPHDDALGQAIEQVQSVGLNGQGHENAISAMKVLNSASIESIPRILQGMEGANPISTNWFRSAVVSIVGRGGELPRSAIQEYFDNRENSHLGRLLAFDLLSESDEQFEAKTVPTLISDPSLPLRSKAVAAFIKKAESAEPQAAIGILGVALDKSRDWEQVLDIADRMGKLGISIDVQQQLGFISTWKLVGSFDNKDEAGFDVAHGPEKNLESVDEAGSYENMDGESSSWVDHNTTELTGVVDLNEVIGKVKGATAYAVSSFDCPEDRTGEIRIGCSNAHKVWVNGELVVSNEIYHNGISPDKFAGTTKLKKGVNTILVKVCQNEQTQPWAQLWNFQLRVCDETGKAIEPTPKPPQQF